VNMRRLPVAPRPILHLVVAMHSLPQPRRSVEI
jgi:hypothetical protein